MPKVHDRGGWPTDEPIEKEDHAVADWEVRANAIRQLLGARGLLKTDELRRGIESLPPAKYESIGYFERWVESMELLLVEKSVVTREDLDERTTALRAGASR